MKSFKDSFEYTQQGRLKRINMDKWSIKQKDKFDEILFHMGQNQSLQSTIGSSPLYGRTSSIGRMITTLIGYPMEQFNVHGVEGVRYLDKTSLLQATSAFAGTYIGLKARYAMLGKDVDDETLLTYALMSVPQLGALSSMRAMTDPAVFSVMGDILGVIGVDSRK